MPWYKPKDKEPPNQDDEYFVKNGGDNYLVFWDNEEKEFYQIQQSCKMTYFEKEQFPNIEWWDEEECNQDVLWQEAQKVINDSGLHAYISRAAKDKLKTLFTLIRK